MVYGSEGIGRCRGKCLPMSQCDPRIRKRADHAGYRHRSQFPISPDQRASSPRLREGLHILPLMSPFVGSSRNARRSVCRPPQGYGGPSRTAEDRHCAGDNSGDANDRQDPTKARHRRMRRSSLLALCWSEGVPDAEHTCRPLPPHIRAPSPRCPRRKHLHSSRFDRLPLDELRNTVLPKIQIAVERIVLKSKTFGIAT